jgi:hypothetical protein
MRTASIITAVALVLEAVSTSEEVTNFYQITRREYPKGNRVNTHRRKNLKYHHIP